MKSNTHTVDSISTELGAASAQVNTDLPRHLSAMITWNSDELFSGQRELIIQHQGEQYRLRITRQEKLILTK